MDAIEALKTRRSIRAFTSDPVKASVVEDIVECARQAATAENLQPWVFVVVTEGNMRRRLAHTTEHGAFISEAPVCIAVLCSSTRYYLEDGCAATQNLLVAAHAHGLGSCWVAGDKKNYADTVRQMLEAPPNYRLVSLVALGYGNETPEITKRPFEQVIRWEKF